MEIYRVYDLNPHYRRLGSWKIAAKLGLKLGIFGNKSNQAPKILRPNL